MIINPKLYLIFNDLPWELIIGTEIHIQLNFKLKLFSQTSLNVSELDIGLPGSLPSLNLICINKIFILSRILNSLFNYWIVFNRKNYFYPDLSLGYQITQNNLPIIVNGYIFIYIENINRTFKRKKINLNKGSLEQDTAKIINYRNFKYINYHRSGIILFELVTKPELNSTNEVKLYLIKIKSIVMYIGLSNCFMNKSEMRIDLNISICKPLNNLLNKVEIKNINSIDCIDYIINFEFNRQINNNNKFSQTRNFDSKKLITNFIRKKELLFEYKNLFESDLMPIKYNFQNLDKFWNINLDKFNILYILQKKIYINKFNKSYLNFLIKNKFFIELNILIFYLIDFELKQIDINLFFLKLIRFIKFINFIEINLFDFVNFVNLIFLDKSYLKTLNFIKKLFYIKNNF